MKIGICQINPIVGDLEHNFKKIAHYYEKSKNLELDLVVTPELSLIGYPPKDLIFKRFFIEKVLEKQHALTALTKSGGPGLIFGSLGMQRNPHYLHNNLVFARNGDEVHIHSKFLLPDYDVFDEVRYFGSGNIIDIVELNGKKLGLTVCEDIWNDVDYWEQRRYRIDPVEELCKKGVDIVINISASPFFAKKYIERFQVLSHVSSKYGVATVFVNQVGANDELIFDGKSMVVDKEGDIIFMGKSFKEDFRVVDLFEESKTDLPDISFEEEVYYAATCGIKDYLEKTGFKKVVIGISGGVDSAIVAKLACDAIGSDNVIGITMPSMFSSENSVADSIKLAQNIGMKLFKIPIKSVYESFLSELAPIVKDTKFSTAEENIQARIRGTFLMFIANKFGYLLLTTGNKSELAVGYCTLYGDMNGALNPIGDIYKTDIYKLCKFINREKEFIPTAIIEKAPSAELRHNQKDQDSLPDYEVLDEILKCYLEHEQEFVEIVAKGFDESTVLKVLKMVDISEYKRKQSPVIFKMSKKAFGTGRRYPVVQGWWKNRKF